MLKIQYQIRSSSSYGAPLREKNEKFILHLNFNMNSVLKVNDKKKKFILHTIPGLGKLMKMFAFFFYTFLE